MMILKTCTALFASLVLSLLAFANCSAFPKKLSKGDAAQLDGKGLTIVVLPPSSLSSSLDGAWLSGALGQAVKGNSLEKKLQLKDPAIAVQPELMQYFSSQYHMTRGTDYQLTIETSYWGIFHRFRSKSDDLQVVGIIDMKLTANTGRGLARIEFNGIADQPQYNIPADRLAENNGELAQRAFDNVSHKAALRFIEWISN